MQRYVKIVKKIVVSGTTEILVGLEVPLEHVNRVRIGLRLNITQKREMQIMRKAVLLLIVQLVTKVNTEVVVKTRRREHVQYVLVGERISLSLFITSYTLSYHPIRNCTT